MSGFARRPRGLWSEHTISWIPLHSYFKLPLPPGTKPPLVFQAQAASSFHTPNSEFSPRASLRPKSLPFPWHLWHRREWQPTPVFFLENPMDREAWQSDKTKHTCTAPTKPPSIHVPQPCHEQEKVLANYSAGRTSLYSLITRTRIGHGILMTQNKTILCWSQHDLVQSYFLNLHQAYHSRIR